MKNIVSLIAACMLCTLGGTTAAAEGINTSLICSGNGALIRASTWTRGCGDLNHFYQELHLKSDSSAGGTIDISVGYEEFPFQQPGHCDNPRGTYVTSYLPLPVDTGVWTITEAGEVLGKVSFISILPCRVVAL